MVTIISSFLHARLAEKIRHDKSQHAWYYCKAMAKPGKNKVTGNTQANHTTTPDAVPISTSKRQSGSFMALALIALIGTFTFVTPSAISKTIEKCTDNKFDADDTYDLKLSYDLGFTDSDINALQYAECVEAVNPASDNVTSVSEGSAINAVSVYPDLFIHVTGARKEIAMSDSYRRLVNNAREYIEINIEPSLSVAREQAITSEIKKEINELSDSVAEADEKAQALDEELAELDEEYESSLKDFESEQESINEAKAAIQANEKSAQASIESGKKNLTSVLNEVYSKSVVTASDIKRAQGLSNYVSGSEQSSHNKFTSQWAELSNIETQLHEDQVALTEQKEQREKEIAEEKATLSQDKIEAATKIDTLNEQLDANGGRWIIEDRSSIPAYESLSNSDHDMKEKYSPVGAFIFLLSLITSVIVVITIITRNRSRIISWQRRGLEDRIIVALFVRRTVLAACIGSTLGAIIGCIASPMAYMYSYADIMGVPFSSPGIEWSRPLIGILAFAAACGLTALITFTFRVGGRTTVKTAPMRKASKNIAPETRTGTKPPLKIDSLQESLLQKYSPDEQELISRKNPRRSLYPSLSSTDSRR